VSSWIKQLNANPILQLLESDQPWVRFNTLRFLLDKSEETPEVAQARTEVLAHPQVQAMIEETSGWPGYPLTRHNDANHPIHKLGILADFGLNKDDPGMGAVTDALLSNQTPDGAFASLIKVPKAFGGSDEAELSWMLCDTPLVLQALLRFGVHDHPAVGEALSHLTNLARENGWPCAAADAFVKFRGPGRKDDPCPYANLIAVRALAHAPGYSENPALLGGVEMLLNHWEQRADRKVYMFGIGTTYQRLKYPLIWYDLLHVLETLSMLPSVHDDPRFKQMVQVLLDQQDEQGMFTAGSVWMAFKGWEFAQKKTPSAWITFLALRILRRVSLHNEFD
jgi:hypothetical protein